MSNRLLKVVALLLVPCLASSDLARVPVTVRHSSPQAQFLGQAVVPGETQFILSFDAPAALGVRRKATLSALAESVAVALRTDSTAHVRELLRGRRIFSMRPNDTLEAYTLQLADRTLPIPRLMDWPALAEMIWRKLVLPPEELHASIERAMVAQSRILEPIPLVKLPYCQFPGTRTQESLSGRNTRFLAGWYLKDVPAIDESRRILRRPDADLSQDWIRINGDLDSYVERPAQALGRLIVSAGGLPFDSNAYGPGLKGVWWRYLDQFYFTPLTAADYDLEALAKEPLGAYQNTSAKQAPVHVGVIGAAGTFGRVVTRELLQETRGMSVSVKAVDVSPATESLRDSDTFRPFEERVEWVRGDASLILRDPAIKAVFITSRAHDHFELAKAALLAGKDVHVQKPLVLSAQEASELVEIAQQTGRIFAVGHQHPYAPEFQNLGEMAARGELGQILRIEGWFQDPIRERVDRTITPLQDVGCHLLSMVHAIVPVGAGADILKARRSDTGETVDVELRYGHVSVAIHVSREWDAPSHRSLTVVGDRFRATYDFSGQTAKLTVKPTGEAGRYDPRELNRLRMKAENRVLFDPPLGRDLMAFLEAVETRNPPLNSAETAIPIIETIEHIEARFHTAPARSKVTSKLRAVVLFPSFASIPPQIPKVGAENLGHLVAPFILQLLELHHRFQIAAVRSGLVIEVVAYAGECITQSAAMVAAGALSRDEGVRLAEAVYNAIADESKKQPTNHVYTLAGKDAREVLDRLRGTFGDDVYVAKYVAGAPEYEYRLGVEDRVVLEVETFLRQQSAEMAWTLMDDKNQFYSHAEKISAARPKVEALAQQANVVAPRVTIISHANQGLIQSAAAVREAFLHMVDVPAHSADTVEWINSIQPDLIVGFGSSEKTRSLLEANGAQIPYLQYDGQDEISFDPLAVTDAPAESIMALARRESSELMAPLGLTTTTPAELYLRVLKNLSECFPHCMDFAEALLHHPETFELGWRLLEDAYDQYFSNARENRREMVPNWQILEMLARHRALRPRALELMRDLLEHIDLLEVPWDQKEVTILHVLVGIGDDDPDLSFRLLNEAMGYWGAKTKEQFENAGESQLTDLFKKLAHVSQLLPTMEGFADRVNEKAGTGYIYLPIIEAYMKTGQWSRVKTVFSKLKYFASDLILKAAEVAPEPLEEAIEFIRTAVHGDRAAGLIAAADRYLKEGKAEIADALYREAWTVSKDTLKHRIHVARDFIRIARDRHLEFEPGLTVEILLDEVQRIAESHLEEKWIRDLDERDVRDKFAHLAVQALANAGRFEEAETLADRQTGQFDVIIEGDRKDHAYYDLAVSAASRGEFERTYEYLRKLPFRRIYATRDIALLLARQGDYLNAVLFACLSSVLFDPVAYREHNMEGGHTNTSLTGYTPGDTFSDLSLSLLQLGVDSDSVGRLLIKAAQKGLQYREVKEIVKAVQAHPTLHPFLLTILEQSLTNDYSWTPWHQSIVVLETLKNMFPDLIKIKPDISSVKQPEPAFERNQSYLDAVQTLTPEERTAMARGRIDIWPLAARPVVGYYYRKYPRTPFVVAAPVLRRTYSDDKRYLIVQRFLVPGTVLGAIQDHIDTIDERRWEWMKEQKEVHELTDPLAAQPNARFWLLGASFPDRDKVVDALIAGNALISSSLDKSKNLLICYVDEERAQTLRERLTKGASDDAWRHARASQWKEAVLDAERALYLSDSHPKNLAHLAVIYARAGRDKDNQSCFAAAEKYRDAEYNTALNAHYAEISDALPVFRAEKRTLPRRSKDKKEPGSEPKRGFHELDSLGRQGWAGAPKVGVPAHPWRRNNDAQDKSRLTPTSPESRLRAALEAVEHFGREKLGLTESRQAEPGIIREAYRGHSIVHLGFSGSGENRNRLWEDPFDSQTILTTTGLWNCQASVAAILDQAGAVAAGLLHQSLTANYPKKVFYVEQRAEELGDFLKLMLTSALPGQRLWVSFYREDQEALMRQIVNEIKNGLRVADLKMLFISRPDNNLSTAIVTKDGVALHNNRAADVHLSWSRVNTLLGSEQLAFRSWKSLFPGSAAARKAA